MLPDAPAPVPSPKAAEAFEAQLRTLTLAQPPATLDARMHALFAAPPVAARIRGRNFWPTQRRWVGAATGLAACLALVAWLAWHTDTRPVRQAPVATTQTSAQLDSIPKSAPVSIFEGAVPVGYRYQGSRTLYAQEIPMGTLRSHSPLDAPQQAYQRRVMLRHTFQDPNTHALYEVDAPQDEFVLETLHSY